MVGFKVSVITIVVLATVYYSSSTKTLAAEKCEDILNEEFEIGPSDGLKNFKKAFKSLSVKEITNKFLSKDKIIPGESDDQTKIRRIKNYLTMDYFLSLIEGARELDLTSLKHPYKFCVDEVQTDTGPMYDLCKKLVMQLRLGKHFFLIRSRKGILEHLYKHWSNNTLKYDNIIDNFPVDLINEQTPNDADRFAMGFFKHYEEFVDKLDEGQGEFISVVTYCQNVGEPFVTIYYPL